MDLTFFADLQFGNSFIGVYTTIILINYESEKGKGFYAFPLLTLSLALLSVSDYLLYSGRIFEVTWLYGVFDPLIFAVGPLFLIYVTGQLRGKARYHKRDYLHFLPAVIFLLVYMAVIQTNPPDQKSILIEQDIISFTNDSDAFLIFAMLHILIYIIIAFRKTAFYKTKVDENYSDTAGYDLKWLQLVMIMTLILWLVSFIYSFNKIPWLLYLQSMVLSGVFVISGIKAGAQPVPFTDIMPEDIIEPGEAKNTAKKTVDEQEQAEILRDLEKIMTDEKPFLDPGLRLTTLASLLSISPHRLSYVINNNLKRNFADYIALHRVNEFSRRVENGDAERMTLLAVAFECGFNSKTSFNLALKRVRGVTPSEFVKLKGAKSKP